MAPRNNRNSPSKKPARNAPAATAPSNKVDIHDLEDQAYLFWDRNKGLVLGAVAFIFAVFVGYQGIKFLQARSEEKLMAGYQAADSSEAKAAWAEEEAGHPLSGFAFKELGDEAFAAGEFAKAENYYREAAEAASAPIDQAATLSLAITLIEQGKVEEAKPLLESVADDDTALAQAEAQYRLAQLAKEEDDTATVQAYSEAISEEAYFWKARAEALAN